MSVCVDVFGDSCKCKPTSSLEELPEATVNQPYFAQIKIEDGGVMNTEDNINFEVSPEHTGLTVTRIHDSGWYEGIEISGTPKFQGDITIHLEGVGAGYPPCFFDKVFTLKVNPATE